MDKISQDESNLATLINSIRDAEMILNETCVIYEPDSDFSEVDPNLENVNVNELEPSLHIDLGLKVKRIDTINKGTTKKKQKPGKAKKLVPTDVQLKRREKRLERRVRLSVRTRTNRWHLSVRARTISTRAY